jgi:hypothetical protein
VSRALWVVPAGLDKTGLYYTRHGAGLRDGLDGISSSDGAN